MERYGKCKHCEATGKVILKDETSECFACHGTGFSGDATVYLQQQYDFDWERERPHFYEPRELL